MRSRAAEMARTRRRLAREREARELGQQGLFGDSIYRTSADTPPRRTSSPPCTSRQAFKEVIATGKRAGQKRELLAWMREQGTPLTSAEIAARSGMGRHVVGRRLPDLERDGHVHRLPARVCAISGRNAITWTCTT